MTHSEAAMLQQHAFDLCMTLADVAGAEIGALERRLLDEIERLDTKGRKSEIVEIGRSDSRRTNAA